MRRELEASYSVEASFLFPVITAIMLAVVALGMFMHNRIKLMSDNILMEEYALQLCREAEGEGLETQLRAYGGILYGKGYFAAAARLDKIRVSSFASVNDIKISAVMGLPPFMLYPGESLKGERRLLMIDREAVKRLTTITAELFK